MLATGEGERGILVIAEAPGKTEDEQGKQLVGDAGQLLRKHLARLGIDLDRDTRKINAVNCRPENNRTPTDLEINCCRQYVWQEINNYKPKLILLLGNIALKSFFGDRMKGSKKDDIGGINKWRGWTIPDRELQAWVCPTFHPSFVDRSQNYLRVVETIFQQDLTNAITKLNQGFPSFQDDCNSVQVLLKEDDVIHALQHILSVIPPEIAFDFETTGRKPYIAGHRVVSSSIAYQENNTDIAISFLVDHKHQPWKNPDKIKDLLRAVLEHPNIKKTAHNLKFEQTWARVRLNAILQNRHWCTMNCAHLLDNRGGKDEGGGGITGLKFQTYVNFGILDYSSEVEPYLKSTKVKDANAFNNIDDAPIEKLLLYGGLDSIYTLRLKRLQKEAIDKDKRLQEVYQLWMDGLDTMAEMEFNGINTDLPYVDDQMQRLVSRMDNLQELLALDTDIQKWREWKGDKFNLSSHPQLGEFLTQHRGIDLPMTDKGNPSTAASALEAIEDSVPFIKRLHDIARLKKVHGTNLTGIKREAPDGVLHCFYNLHIARSGRSSASAINFQNQDKRNKEMERIVRRAFIPSPGNLLMEADFKGIEVAISCCVHKDRNMIRYVSDKKTDMHRDQAMELFLLPQAEVIKETRQSAKNDFVFPQFYGDWYESCALSLWKDIGKFNLTTTSGVSLYDHLEQQGIKTINQFIKHVQDCEYRFWHERFHQYNEWKQDHYKRYEKCGYFYLLTGFKCCGVMDRKQATNYPIQGVAFHCLLWTANRVREIIKRERMKSKLIGQIHDSVVNDVVPQEKEQLIQIYHKVVYEDLRNAFPYIIVPMEIEMECTGINQSWFTKKKIN